MQAGRVRSTQLEITAFASWNQADRSSYFLGTSAYCSVGLDQFLIDIVEDGRLRPDCEKESGRSRERLDVSLCVRRPIRNEFRQQAPLATSPAEQVRRCCLCHDFSDAERR